MTTTDLDSRIQARGLGAALLIILFVAMSPAVDAAERFELLRAGDGSASLALIAAPDLDGMSLMQELLDADGQVVDSVELTLATARPDGSQELRWRPERAHVLADGPATVRFILSAADPATGESVVEMFTVPASVEGRVAYLSGAPERAAFEISVSDPFQAIDETTGTAGPAAKGGIALPPPPDPTTRKSYNCYYVQTYHWNYGGDGVPKVIGKIRWPSATCSIADGPPSGRPMMIFTHGNNMTHTDHDYLMAHLARNGFVTASVSNGGFDGGSNEGRARQAISYLNGMHAYWGWKHRLSDKVVFAGHSRGGEAAITASRLLHESPSLGHEDYDVRAVISIAPTDGEGVGHEWAKENLTGSMTPAFLGIYGSRDPDVRGLPINPWPTGPENTVFAIYDRAGSEFSSEGFVLAGVHLTKALVFVDRASHRGFMDSDNCFPVLSDPDCTDHRNVTKAYFNAFLRWHVFDQTDHRGFFDGQWRPPALSGLVLAQQYSGGTRRVVDNFEQGGWSSNTMGSSVLKGAGIAVLGEDDLIDMDPATPHATRGMRIKWGNPGSKYVWWKIPNQSPFGIGSLRNISSYNYLSLRAGQTYNDAWNVPDQAQSFHVRLYSNQGWSSKIPVSAYGDLAYPNAYKLLPPPDYVVKDFTKTTMETIRVPLQAFTNVNLENVSWVALYFDVPGHGAGSVQIDSLEFTR